MVHADSYPLEVLAGILNGKTGRLYKKLVEEKGIAKSSAERSRRMMPGDNLSVSAGQDSKKYAGRRMMPGENLSVSASQDSKKYAGAFQITAEGIADTKPEQLEEAIYEVIRR